MLKRILCYLVLVVPSAILANALFMKESPGQQRFFDSRANVLRWLTPEQAEILSHMVLVHDDGLGNPVPTIQFRGVNVQIVNGLGATSTTNARGNLILGYNEAGAPGGDVRTGSHNILVGARSNYPSYASTRTDYLTLPETATPSTGQDEGALYSRSHDGATDLFFREESSGFEYPLSIDSVFMLQTPVLLATDTENDCNGTSGFAGGLISIGSHLPTLEYRTAIVELAGVHGASPCGQAFHRLFSKDVDGNGNFVGSAYLFASLNVPQPGSDSTIVHIPIDQFGNVYTDVRAEGFQASTSVSLLGFGR